MTDLVWSYSMLDTYEQCPLMFYDRYILKNKQPETESLRHGKFIHSSIEDYLRGVKTDLPEELERNKLLIGSIKNQFKDMSKVELKLGLNKSLKPTGFFDGDVWGRGAADVVIIHHNSDSAFLGDWKTGKKYEKEDQLKILAMMLFKQYGKLMSITAANIWLKDNTIGEQYTFKRTDEDVMWVSLLKRLQPMYDAIGTAKVTETRPGFICNYCPVKSCKFNKS